MADKNKDQGHLLNFYIIYLKSLESGCSYLMNIR